MEAPDFWNDTEVSQKKMKELKSLKDDIQTYGELQTRYEDIETLLAMGEEEGELSLLPEIEEAIQAYQQQFEAIRIKTQIGRASCRERVSA